MTEIEIFNSALKLSASERVQFLGLACKDNPEFRRQIDELLQAHFGKEKGTGVNGTVEP